MKARTKFAIAIGVLSLLLGGAMYGGLELYKQQEINELRSSVNETADLAAVQISRDLQEKRNYVEYTASRPRARRFDQRNAYLDQFLDSSDFFAAQIIADNGTVIAFRGGIRQSIRKAIIGMDRSDTKYFQASKNGKVYTSNVEYANQTDRYLLTISAPIYDVNDELKGVFVGALYLNNQTVFSTVDSLESRDRSVLVDNGTRFIEARDRRFSRSISGQAQVESTNWTVIVTRDANPLFQQLQWLAVGQGVGIFLLLAIILGFGYWQYATNLRQADRLLDAFSELQRGNFDYSLSLAAEEEWRQISNGFNEMASGLKEREREIRERERRLGVLNRVLRHNLQNDIGVVINYAEMIPEFDDAQEEMAVEKIVSKSKDLLQHGKKARQIEEAMDTAEEGLYAIDVVGSIERIIDDLGDDYPEATIRTSLPDEQHVIGIQSLETAIRNVVENALEHNDSDDPVVEITTETDDTGRTVLTVMDNGPGIPEYEQQIFTAGQDETSLEHGSGIGLWLVYWIVEKSGGELEFDKAYEEGARVRLRFDTAPTQASPGQLVEETATTADSMAAD
ncbi:MAG: sensor histidine kinase [Halorhabdus sp.]